MGITPCNEPTLIFADFPSFPLALLARIHLLLPNKDVSRPASFLSLARLQLGSLPLQQLLTESGWSGSPFALLPLPSVLLGKRQSAETQPCHLGVEINKRGSIASLGMKWFLLYNL